MCYTKFSLSALSADRLERAVKTGILLYKRELANARAFSLRVTASRNEQMISHDPPLADSTL